MQQMHCRWLVCCGLSTLVFCGSALGEEKNAAQAAIEAVMKAVQGGNKEKVSELLGTGGIKLISEADDLLELLLEKGYVDLVEVWWAQVEKAREMPDEEPMPRVLLAGEAQSGHLRAVKLLIGKRVPLDTSEYGQGTPLMHAVRAHHADVARFLLQSGASVESTDVTGNTILTAAVFEGDPGVIEEVLRAHPKLNRVAEDGTTALGLAGKFASPAVVARLLGEPGIAVNATDREGLTPLMHAAEMGQDGNVIALLKAGATRELKTPDGRTAEAIAREAGQVGVLRILKGDSELGQRLADAKPEEPTADELSRVSSLLERWLVDHDWKAVEAALDPRFDSSQVHRRASEYPKSLRKFAPVRRAFELPLVPSSNCAVQCRDLEACIETPTGRFDAYVSVVGSDEAHLGPVLEQFIGQKILWVETRFRGCGLGVILGMTHQGSASRIVMLEYAPVD